MDKEGIWVDLWGVGTTLPVMRIFRLIALVLLVGLIWYFWPTEPKELPRERLEVPRYEAPLTILPEEELVWTDISGETHRQDDSRDAEGVLSVGPSDTTRTFVISRKSRWFPALRPSLSVEGLAESDTSQATLTLQRRPLLDLDPWAFQAGAAVSLEGVWGSVSYTPLQVFIWELGTSLYVNNSNNIKVLPTMSIEVRDNLSVGLSTMGSPSTTFVGLSYRF